MEGSMTRLILSLLILLVLLVMPAAARACSCAEPPPPLQAMSEATAVFAGKVVEAEAFGGNQYAYTIRVYAVWKGPAPDFIELWTSDVAMCGLLMGVGTEFLVYAAGDPESMAVSNCSRSRALEFAAADLDELGDPLTVPTGEATMTTLKARYE